MALSKQQKRRILKNVTELGPAPLHYIQYARRSSSKGSRKQEQSIGSQNKELQRIAEQQGLRVIDRLEESQTAKEPGRPIFNAMIRRIEAGEANAILVWHLDRLTRNEKDSGTIRWLLRNGVIREIRTPHRVYLPGDSAVITAVESAIGEQFIPDHIAKVQRGMLDKCARGEVPFMVPEGYLNDKLTRKAKADPLRFPVIRKLFHLILTESCSVREAHRIMHEDWGYRRKENRNSTSSGLTVTSVYKLLANPFYCGYFSWQGQVYVHDLPRIVTKEEFDRVQAILHKRGYKKTKRYTFPYTGLIRCASCGYAITAEVSKGHTYYHCANRLGLCTKKGIREEELDRRIDALLASIQMPPEFETTAKQVLAELSADQKAEDRAKVDARERAMRELKTQRERLLSIYLQGHVSPDEYAERKYEISEQEARLLLDQEQSGLEWQAVDETVANAVHFSVHARSAFSTGDALAKRFASRHVAEDFFLNNGELTVHLHPIFKPMHVWKQQDRRKGPGNPAKPVSASKVRTFAGNGALRLKKFEPSPTPVLNLSGARDSANFQLWWTRLDEYRTLVREGNWVVPRMPELTQAAPSVPPIADGERPKKSPEIPTPEPARPDRAWSRVELPDLRPDATAEDIRKAYVAGVAAMSLAGMREKAARGGFPHRAPIGYLNAIGPDGERTVKVDPVLGPLMRRAFELAAGGETVPAISRGLCPLGLTDRKGRPVPRETLRTALRNPFYIGMLRHRGRLLPGNHEPLVTKELFERAKIGCR